MIGRYLAKQIRVIDKTSEVVYRLNQFLAGRYPDQRGVIRMLEAGIAFGMVLQTDFRNYLFQTTTDYLGAPSTATQGSHIFRYAPISCHFR